MFVRYFFYYIALTLIFFGSTSRNCRAVTGLFSDINVDQIDNGSSWFMDKMSIREAHNYSNGSGVIVALIDSGVQVDHPALSTCIDKQLSYNVADDNFDITDYLGHGTMMAGIICGSCDNGMPFCGVAPGSKLIVYKITSGSGYSFQDDDLAEAVRLAADGPASVINLSLTIGSSTQVEDAVIYALQKGKIVVAAAGNTGGVVSFPASIDGVTAVGGINTDVVPLPGSGTGPYLILSAPGYNIGTTINDYGFGATTGTSASAALVSGVFALIQSREPATSAGTQMAMITQDSIDEGWPGFDGEYGFGIVNALYSAANINPLQTDPKQEPSVSLYNNLLSYHREEAVTLTVKLRGIGGHKADIWIQETDPRGKRLYFVYGANQVYSSPYPYNTLIGSPFLFPEGSTLDYNLFHDGGSGLLGNGYIDPHAPKGLYEMTVGLQESQFFYTRIVVWIDR